MLCSSLAKFTHFLREVGDMLQNFKVPGKLTNKKHHIVTDVFSRKI